jgi:hypothetical protein
MHLHAPVTRLIFSFHLRTHRMTKSFLVKADTDRQ